MSQGIIDYTWRISRATLVLLRSLLSSFLGRPRGGNGDWGVHSLQIFVVFIDDLASFYGLPCHVKGQVLRLRVLTLNDGSVSGAGVLARRFVVSLAWRWCHLLASMSAVASLALSCETVTPLRLYAYNYLSRCVLLVFKASLTRWCLVSPIQKLELWQFVSLEASCFDFKPWCATACHSLPFERIALQCLVGDSSAIDNRRGDMLIIVRCDHYVLFCI